VEKQETRPVKITGCMTAPRYVNCYCRNIIDAAFRKTGIPLQVSGGVFYGQCMQKMLEDSIAAGVDVAVTVDGDSVFTANDLMQVIQTLVQSDADAVSCFQARRGDAVILASLRQGNSIQVGDEPIKVATAHFGLTAIDLHKLAKVPKPWFITTADAQGEFGDGRVDDDIHFWRQWEKAGNSLYIDPKVRIGHLEEMVVVHDATTYETKHVYPSQWVKECLSS
jgi:hypothetical protein